MFVEGFNFFCGLYCFGGEYFMENKLVWVCLILLVKL